MKRFLSMALGIAISAALLYIVFRDVKPEPFFASLGRLQWRYLPLLLALSVLGLILRAFRWKHLLPNSHELSTQRLFEALTVGFFSSMVLPLRAGEFIRPLYLSRLQPVTFSVGFASVVVERVFDVLALMCLLAVALLWIDEAPPTVVLGAKALTVLAAAIIVVMVVSYFWSHRVAAVIQNCSAAILGKKHPALAAAVNRMGEEFLLGLRGISSAKELALVIFWSLLLWLEASLLYQAGLWALGVYPSFIVGVTVNVLIALAVAAPSAPGFLGTFQYGCLLALSTIYHYPDDFAAAYSVFIHVLQVLILCVLGLTILKVHGLHLRDLRASEHG